VGHLRLCLEPRCPNLVEKGRCSAHQAVKAWSSNNESTRIRGRKLQALRADLFNREPLCRECVKAGRTRAATIRDHILPLAEGGTDDGDNIQPLCQACSDTKTQQESRRGIHRARMAS
jgi:5-methylcytosine-specific restriction protein A